MLARFYDDFSGVYAIESRNNCRENQQGISQKIPTIWQNHKPAKAAVILRRKIVRLRFLLEFFIINNRAAKIKESTIEQAVKYAAPKVGDPGVNSDGIDPKLLTKTAKPIQPKATINKDMAVLLRFVSGGSIW